tara:strand:+ start:370 stop:501 length:132 start_codon:yes stop_codon:yes gene_type:complete
MIKRITLALLICCVIVSCGKKGSPEYKDSEKKAGTQNILINKA